MLHSTKIVLIFFFFFPASPLLRSTMSEKWDSNSSESWNHIWSGNDTQHHWYSDINITYVNYYLHQPQVAAVFISSYLLIFVLCMVGNTVVCFIVIRNRHMHTVTNFFILNLAISDLLVGIFCMPITLLDNIIAGMLACALYNGDLRKVSTHTQSPSRVIRSLTHTDWGPRSVPSIGLHKMNILNKTRNKQIDV